MAKGSDSGGSDFLRPLVVLTVAAAVAWGRYFITGHSITGRPTDNATFFYAATQDLRGRPYEKLSDAIWKRLARRWVALGVPQLFAALSVFDVWTDTDWLAMIVRWWILITLAGTGWGGWKMYRLIRDRRVTNEYVYPTWEAACKVLGLVYHRSDARKMVELPDGFDPRDRTETDDMPAVRHWAVRWSGIGRLLDRRAARKLAAEQARLAAEQEAREADDTEPTIEETAPSTEVAVRSQTGTLQKWLPYPAAFRRAGSHARTEDPPVRINLPVGRLGSEAQKKAFLLAVGPVLGWPEPNLPTLDPFLEGQAPYVLLRPVKLPPPKVSFDDVKKYFEASTLARPFVGIAADNRPVYLDLAKESPHTLLSGPTNTGKSTLLKTPLPIRMHLGAGLIIGDFKRVSHLWAHNLPGCVYAWKIEQIHNVFVAAGQELMRRIEGVLPENYDHTIELTRFDVWDIVVEEINSLTPMLQRYWQNIRGPKDPVPSPALIAIQQIIFMGREMGLHVWVGSQRASANVFGGDGGSTRENFAARFMAKWTKQTWAMLAGGVPYVKCPKGGQGIWTLVQGDEVDIIRVPWITNAEAREWATSGVPSPATPLDQDMDILGPSTPIVPAGVSTPELVTLSKALEFLPGPPMSLPALRQAASPERSKVNGFPAQAGEAGAAKTYELAALVEWKLALDARKGLEQSWEAAEPRREAWVYRFDVLDPETGAVVCGYVGQTHSLKDRERQHRGDKPWADLIVGSIVVIWHGWCTQEELNDLELHHIQTLLPLFNIEGNEDNPGAVKKWTQVEQRHARDAEAGRELWEPVDEYALARASVI